MNDNLQWLGDELKAQGHAQELCQCQTVRATAASSDPQRYVAVYFSYSFLDQFVYTNYRYAHATFKQEFSGPRLAAHGSGGHASPAWLLSSKGCGLESLNIPLLASVFADLATEVMDMLSASFDIPRTESLAHMQREMKGLWLDAPVQSELSAVIAGLGVD